MRQFSLFLERKKLFDGLSVRGRPLKMLRGGRPLWKMHPLSSKTLISVVGHNFWASIFRANTKTCFSVRPVLRGIEFTLVNSRTMSLVAHSPLGVNYCGTSGGGGCSLRWSELLLWSELLRRRGVRCNPGGVN